MKRFVVVFLAVIGLLSILIFLGLAAVLVVGLSSVRGIQTVPAKTVLEIDLETPVVEDLPKDPLSRLVMEEAIPLPDLLDALDKASRDTRVVGLVARIGSAGMGLGKIQELREAVQSFRESGKPAVAFSETFGEFSPGNGSYYLATAFDEIDLQPSGDVGLAGLRFEYPFVRGALDKLDVLPRFEGRYEYKDAINTYTETGFTEPQREATERIMKTIFDQIVRGVAEARHRPETEVRTLIDRGPFVAQEALDAGLVDRLAYRDEVDARVKEEAGDGAVFLGWKDYLERAGHPHTRGRTIALIHGYGEIHRGESQHDPISSSVVLGADTVTEAFRSAIDENVAAIVFRVSSPGGSYVASDGILRATERAKAKGIPVIVSMGDYGASGGYFISMAADKIVAQPGTLTGSIGVFGGKMVTTGLFEKLGVTFDAVQTSPNAGIYSSTQDYTDSEWERLRTGLDRIYEDFTTKVAAHRGIKMEAMPGIARGRVWTGEEAKTLGLVDDLGGLATAYRLAAEAAGIGPEEAYRVRVFPPRKSTLDLLLEGRLFDSQSGASLATVCSALERTGPLARLAAALGLTRRGEPLRARIPWSAPSPSDD